MKTNKELQENLEFCEQWFTKEIIKNHFENKDEYIKIKKSDLFRVIIKFLKLIEKETNN